jgi:hypothetical protein
MFIERDLVRLVIQLNPYAIPPAMTFASPASGPVLQALNNAIVAANTVAALDAAVPTNLSVFTFQRQDNPAYQMNWTWEFNGQQRIIRRALRIQYHYPVFNGGGAVATEHVLIGYEGGGGP